MPSPVVLPPPLDALISYGQARGWTAGTLHQACRAVTAVLASRAGLGEPPWDAAGIRRFLIERSLVALRAVEFLTDQGLARGNPQAIFERWLAVRLAALPAPFAADVRTWAEALQGRGAREPGRPAPFRDTCASCRPRWPAGPHSISRCGRSPPTT